LAEKYQFLNEGTAFIGVLKQESVFYGEMKHIEMPFVKAS